jgi:hypothetical protein
MASLLKKVLQLVLVVGMASVAFAQSTQDQSAQPAEPQTSPAPSDTQPAAPPQAQSAPAQPQSAPEQPPPSAGESQNPSQPRDPNQPVLKRKSKPKHRKTTAPSQSGKVVVRNGGAKEGTPEIEPGLSKEQELHNRENTSQLLSTTDANLKKIAGRQLTPAQQSMVEKIHTYMNQSKAASSAGDLNRAHTLAFKAHLLSDEVAKK